MILASSVAISASRSLTRWANEDKRRLGGNGHRVGRARGTQALSGRNELGNGEALEAALELVRGTEGQVDASGLSALIRALRAERLATTRTRMASTRPSLLLAVP